MNNIFIFEPSNKNNPHDNVIKFIEFCKSTISNNNLTTSWETNKWKGLYRFTKFNLKNNLNSKECLDDSLLILLKHICCMCIHSINLRRNTQHYQC